MNKPNPALFVWLYITGAVFFLFEWALGATILYYCSQWLGLNTTTHRVLAIGWLLVASRRATVRHYRRKETALYRFNRKDSPVEGDEDYLSEEIISERMAATGRTRREVEEDNKYFGF